MSGLNNLHSADSRNSREVLSAARGKSRRRRGYGKGSGTFKPAGEVRSKTSPKPAEHVGKSETETKGPPLHPVEPTKVVRTRKITRVNVTPDVMKDLNRQIEVGSRELIVPPSPLHSSPFAGMTFLDDVNPAAARKLTEEALQEILLVLADGGSRGDAADIVGVNRTSVTKAAERYPRFAEAMARAEAMGKMDLIRRVKYGDSNWQSAAWMLSRKHRGEFSSTSPDVDENRVVRVRQVVVPKALQGQEGVAALPSPDDIKKEQLRLADGKLEESERARTDIGSGVDTLLDKDGTVITVARS